MAGFSPLVIPGQAPDVAPVAVDTPRSAPVEPVDGVEALSGVRVRPRHHARLAAALRALRWTYGTLAVELGLSPSTTRNWGLGRQPLPGEVLAWLEDLAVCHRERPAPVVSDQRARAG